MAEAETGTLQLRAEEGSALLAAPEAKRKARTDSPPQS